MAAELARLTRENARLQAELDKAALIIDVQKNLDRQSPLDISR